MSASKKRRTGSRTPTSKAPKQSRVCTVPAAKTPKHERLAGSPFPASIMALPHVLELIDLFQMTPAEAAQHAVSTGQSKWLVQILSCYGINVTSPDMLAEVAANGYEKVVKLLLPVLLDARHKKYVHQECWKVVLAAVEVTIELVDTIRCGRCHNGAEFKAYLGRG